MSRMPAAMRSRAGIVVLQRSRREAWENAGLLFNRRLARDAVVRPARLDVRTGEALAGERRHLRRISRNCKCGPTCLLRRTFRWPHPSLVFTLRTR
jgi:hypothetical protein